MTDPASVSWRTSGGNLWARVSPDPHAARVHIGGMSTPALAELAAAEHNAAMIRRKTDPPPDDLAWLAAAGYGVSVCLVPIADEYFATLTFPGRVEGPWRGTTPAEALAKARAWAEKNQKKRG
jgi:hypothetical protein